MNQIPHLIKITSICLIGYTLCVLQTYISMYEYKFFLSSTSLRCSYVKEILTGGVFMYSFSFLVYSFFRFVYSSITKKKGNASKIAVNIVTYVTACFMLNKDVFSSRVTSWSTFSAAEELMSVVYESGIAMLITSIIFYCVVRICYTK